MSIIEAIIQGIVQGATEFLPVSSSGHLSLSQHIMGVQLESLLFDIMLHIGTLIAVVAVYYKLIWRLILELISTVKDIFTKNFHWKTMSHDRRLLFMLMIGLIPLFLLFLPIPGTGMKLKDISDSWATDTNIFIEGLAFLGTSALLFLGIRANEKNCSKTRLAADGTEQHSAGRKKIHTVDALVMGFAQCMAAVFPGLSRSGSTLSSGMIRGINKQTALDYSFVLGIPAILAAAVLSLGDAAAEFATADIGAMVAGVIAAAVVGFIAIKVLKWIVSSNRLRIFAYYTLIIGILTLVIAIVEAITGHNLFTGAVL